MDCGVLGGSGVVWTVLEVEIVEKWRIEGFTLFYSFNPKYETVVQSTKSPPTSVKTYNHPKPNPKTSLSSLLHYSPQSNSKSSSAKAAHIFSLHYMFLVIVKSSIAKISTGRLPIYEAAYGLPYDLDALVMEVISLPRAVLTIEHPCLKGMDVFFGVFRVRLEAEHSLVL